MAGSHGKSWSTIYAPRSAASVPDSASEGSLSTLEKEKSVHSRGGSVTGGRSLPLSRDLQTLQQYGFVNMGNGMGCPTWPFPVSIIHLSLVNVEGYRRFFHLFPPCLKSLLSSNNFSINLLLLLLQSILWTFCYSMLPQYINGQEVQAVDHIMQCLWLLLHHVCVWALQLWLLDCNVPVFIPRKLHLSVCDWMISKIYPPLLFIGINCFPPHSLLCQDYNRAM